MHSVKGWYDSVLLCCRIYARQDVLTHPASSVLMVFFEGHLKPILNQCATSNDGILGFGGRHLPSRAPEEGLSCYPHGPDDQAATSSSSSSRDQFTVLEDALDALETLEPPATATAVAPASPAATTDAPAQRSKGAAGLPALATSMKPRTMKARGVNLTKRDMVKLTMMVEQLGQLELDGRHRGADSTPEKQRRRRQPKKELGILGTLKLLRTKAEMALKEDEQ